VVQVKARWWREIARDGLPTAVRNVAEVGREGSAGCVVRAQERQGEMGKQKVENLVVLMRLKGKDIRARSGVFHGGAAVATPADVRHRGARVG
jgi:hypothetical protein